jgi:hypothetical protein
MKTKTPFLDFYKVNIELGEIPDCGLCNSLDDMDLIPLFEPNGNEILNEDVRFGYWGYNGENELDNSVDQNDRAYKFTPLRQTIVLLCAAMNNEF